MRRACPLVLLAFLALTSCVVEPSSGANPLLPGAAGSVPAAPVPGRTAYGGPVFAIGDSILQGTAEHGGLGVKLAEDGWELETLAETGRTTRWAIEQARVRDTVPRYVVVVLGSNPGHSSAGFSEDVQTLRDALVARGARRILWIPPHNIDPQRYSEKTAILTDRDRLDPRIIVPDWGTVLDQNQDWIGGDGLHLTEAGYDALATYIREQLARLG
jgi:lysophospholipase L1-like esterase